MNLNEQYALGYLEGFTKELAKRVAKLEAAKSDTFDGRCLVPEARVLRWEKLERAAKEAVDRLEFAPPGSSAGVARFVLVEALKP